MGKQTDRVLSYMERHGSITQQEASEALGVARLGARIYDLRRSGHPIVSERETGRNRFGERTRYARYWIRRVKA